MVSARQQPAPQPGSPRFSVLLTRDREHADEHWTGQLPRVLRPLGVEAIVASTGREAIEIAERQPLHAAVIDLATPAGSEQAVATGEPGGLWLLEVLSRRPDRPPTVVVNSRAYSQQQVQRFLNEALRLGAFSVINRPVEVHSLLAVIQRVIERRYQGQWPGPEPGPAQT